MEKARRAGLPAYHAGLAQKAAILKNLLENFNDGRRKTFFSLAVNLLELSEVQAVLEEINRQVLPEYTVQEKAAIAVKCFEAAAKQSGVTLKRNKKPASAKGT